MVVMSKDHSHPFSEPLPNKQHCKSEEAMSDLGVQLHTIMTHTFTKSGNIKRNGKAKSTPLLPPLNRIGLPNSEIGNALIFIVQHCKATGKKGPLPIFNDFTVSNVKIARM